MGPESRHPELGLDGGVREKEPDASSLSPPADPTLAQPDALGSVGRLARARFETEQGPASRRPPQRVARSVHPSAPPAAPSVAPRSKPIRRLGADQAHRDADVVTVARSSLPSIDAESMSEPLAPEAKTFAQIPNLGDMDGTEPGHGSPRRSSHDIAPAPLPGDIVGGTCRIEERLATSDMSVLYRAFHTGLERMVVVKVLQNAGPGNPEAVLRFQREARLMSRMKSEHVAKVLDVGSHAGSPFIVMELLDGADLAYLLKQVGTLPLKQACDLVLQICEALAVAHAHGVVHRDLKPGNVFVSVRAGGDLRVTIIDFGIAKAFFRAAGAEDDDVTRAAALLGSPRYMAPEQVARSGDIDERADIWALAIIFQEILTGQRVFDADNVVSMLMSIIEKPPVPLRTYLPDAPDAIVATIESALVKDRAKRLPNILTFAARVAPFASADAIHRLAMIAAIVTPSATGVDSVPPPSLSPRAVPPPSPSPGASSSVPSTGPAPSPRSSPPPVPSARSSPPPVPAPKSAPPVPKSAPPPSSSVVPALPPPPGGWDSGLHRMPPALRSLFPPVPAPVTVRASSRPPVAPARAGLASSGRILLLVAVLLVVAAAVLFVLRLRGE